MMPWVGLVLLLFVGIGVVVTGLPAAVVLIMAATLGALIGAVSGQVPVDLLTAPPERLINLLENDLVQAIPLYVVMGARCLGRGARPADRAGESAADRSRKPPNMSTEEVERRIQQILAPPPDPPGLDVAPSQ
jgi:hypothetical protein